jgi:large conductance mechanosensitive channel
MLKEFKTFILRGNVVDMAVGIIIGSAFGAIVNALVDYVIMPPIGLLLGKVDFSNLFVILKEGAVPGPYASLAQAQEVGAVALSYGLFINTLISFLIIAFVIFLLIRAVNRMQRPEPAAPAEPAFTCPYCFSEINKEATRCAFCTSELR